MKARRVGWYSIKLLRWALLGLVAFALAACTTQGVFRKPAPERSARVPGGSPSVDLGKPDARTSRPRAKRGYISLAGQCKQTEADGYAEDARVDVINGKVNALDWSITIPRRGSCRFDGKKFRQTKTAPSVELTARDGSGCKLLMWSDPRRVTLAHSGCAKFCTRGAYDKAWPVMFNPKTGRCADIRR